MRTKSIIHRKHLLLSASPIPAREQVPIGEQGEIFVGGEVVSIGYWRRPDLSCQKFYDDGLTRWYRTGDLGRLCSDGKLEILGRLDLSERKINGSRVSLDEVRHAIESLRRVESAWVSAIEPNALGKQVRLVGHFVPSSGDTLDTETAQQQLAAMLPSPARPVALLHHDRFPLTLNGKIDVQALLNEASTYLCKNDDKPCLYLNDRLDHSPEDLSIVLEVAEEFFDIVSLTGSDNFFRCGGDSLSAVKFVLKLGKRINRELSPTVIFSASSFSDIACNMQRNAYGSVSAMRLLRKGSSTDKRLFTIHSTGNFGKLATGLEAGYFVHNLNILGLATTSMKDRPDRFELREICERFADELLELRPAGPWPLVAFCQGGCLAVETARVLQERTKATASLLLIDVFLTDHSMPLAMRVQSAFEFGPKWLWKKSIHRFGRIPRSRATNKRSNQKSKNSEIIGSFQERFYQQFLQYKPIPLNCPVTLFVSREWRHASLDVIEKNLGSNLTIHHIKGRHDKIFSPENVTSLGSKLISSIEK